MAPLKIVVLEDQPFQLLELIEILEDWGYEVYGFNSAKQLKQDLNNVNPDLALLDIRIENESEIAGIEVAKIVSDKLKVPFMFVSTIEKKWNELLITKPASSLKKPYTKDELHKEIKYGLNNFYNNEVSDNNLIVCKRNLLFEKGKAFFKIPYAKIPFIHQSEGKLTISYFIDNKLESFNASGIRPNLTKKLFELLNVTELGNSCWISTQYIDYLERKKGTIRLGSYEYPICN